MTLCPHCLYEITLMLYIAVTATVYNVPRILWFRAMSSLPKEANPQ